MPELSGFDYIEPDGYTSLAACKSAKGIYIASESDCYNETAMVTVEMPQDKAVAFAQWILSQFGAGGGANSTKET